MRPLAMIENVITLAAVVLIAIFCDGGWKLLCIVPMFNLNYSRTICTKTTVPNRSK
jgi:hypothetical protein